VARRAAAGGRSGPPAGAEAVRRPGRGGTPVGSGPGGIVNGSRSMNADGVVLTNAMLVYLAECPGRTATLRELGAHFGVPWQKALDLLWSASLVELGDLVDAYSLTLPVRPGQEEPGEEPAKADSAVSFGAWGSADVPDLPLTLDEVIAIVALVDSVAQITPPGPSADALSAMRAKLVAACEEAGFAGVTELGTLDAAKKTTGAKVVTG